MPKSTAVKKAVDYTKEGLEEPFPWMESSWLARALRKGKARVLILYPDLSYKEHFVRMDERYTFTVKGMTYLKVPKTMLRGKYPLVMYYYNNPLPIGFEFKDSKMSRSILKYIGDEEKLKKELAKAEDNDMVMASDVFIDAKALNVAFTSNLVNKMYHEPTRITTKNVVIVLIVLGITILVMLHAFGVIDIYALLTGQPLK